MNRRVLLESIVEKPYRDIRGGIETRLGLLYGLPVPSSDDWDKMSLIFFNFSQVVGRYFESNE